MLSNLSQSNVAKAYHGTQHEALESINFVIGMIAVDGYCPVNHIKFL